MNDFQRILLLVFTILIVSSSDPSGGKETVIKYFFSAVLLFFCFSPYSWFERDHKQDVNQDKEMIEEDDSEDLEDSESLLPNIGFPTSETYVVLKTLFHLRVAEIGSIYNLLRGAQKNAGDGSWVPHFMEDYAVSKLYYDYYVTVNDEDENRAKSSAIDVYKKSYDSFSIAPFGFSDDNRTSDLRVGLSYKTISPKMMIFRLLEIKSLGYFCDFIDELISQYKKLQELACWGAFDEIFREKVDSKFVDSFEKIDHLWHGINRLLRTYSIISDMSENSGLKVVLHDDVLLKEVSAIEELVASLPGAIARENSRERGISGVSRTQAEEDFLFERLEDNRFFKYK